MASVWYAENSLGKSAAIKVMHKKFADDETTKERFLKEAKAMMKLKSPYIRDVYDQGTFEGLPFILLEYLEGETLKEKILQNEQVKDEVLELWFRQAVSGLL